MTGTPPTISMTAVSLTSALLLAFVVAGEGAYGEECAPPMIDGVYKVVSSRPPSCSVDGDVTGVRLNGGGEMLIFGPSEPSSLEFRLETVGSNPRFVSFLPFKACISFATGCLDGVVTSGAIIPCVWVTYGGCDWELVCPDTDDVSYKTFHVLDVDEDSGNVTSLIFNLFETGQPGILEDGTINAYQSNYVGYSLLSLVTDGLESAPVASSSLSPMEGSTLSASACLPPAFAEGSYDTRTFSRYSSAGGVEETLVDGDVSSVFVSTEDPFLIAFKSMSTVENWESGARPCGWLPLGGDCDFVLRCAEVDDIGIASFIPTAVADGVIVSTFMTYVETGPLIQLANGERMEEQSPGTAAMANLVLSGAPVAPHEGGGKFVPCASRSPPDINGRFVLKSKAALPGGSEVAVNEASSIDAFVSRQRMTVSRCC